MTDVGTCVVAIGVFDGVHRGHQYVIGRAVDRARGAGLPCVVLTFDPHPLAVLRPEQVPVALLSIDDRIAALRESGADSVCVLPFTHELSQLSPAEFVEQVVVRGLHAAGIVVGGNFRFGHRAAGDTATLVELGDLFGFWVETIEMAGDTVAFSSTRVRELVLVGDVSGAAQLLGRPHRLAGVIVHGDHRGRELGFPTANLAAAPGVAVPADGVYAGWLVRADGTRLRAAVSVGTNPTFDGADRRVESYVLDRNDLDLYGEQVGVEFVQRLRPTEKYDTVEALVEQINLDVEQTRALLSS